MKDSSKNKISTNLPTLKDIKASLETFEKDVRKNAGKPKVYVYSTVDETEGLKVIPFGLPDADAATNIGGIPIGRIIELFGLESGGKSWLTLRLLANAQKMGLKAALIDLEHSLDAHWATDNGVDLDTLIYGHDFKNGEEALEYIIDMAKNKVADLIVVDSTAAIEPKDEIGDEKAPSKIKTTVALLARLMSQAVRRLNDICPKKNVTIVFINQIREKPGIMFGNPETTPGGRALKFYSSMRLDVRRVSYIKEKTAGGSDDDDASDSKAIGIKSKFTVVKNKCGAPMGKAFFELYFDPESQSSLTMLAKLAYEMKVLPRKNVDGKMQYFWGKGKDAIPTDCETFIEVSKWFEEQGVDKIKELIASVEAKAAEKGKKFNEDIVQQVKDEYLFEDSAESNPEEPTELKED